jgi:putative addiction module killer protein
MIDIRQSETFSEWFADLRDKVVRARIASRIDRMRDGNFGDAKPVGGGVSELRIHHGPGYRVYFVRRGDTLVILLCGGDKGSQDKDIEAAKTLAKNIEDAEPWH